MRIALTAAMPVRQFTDDNGREWRAWDIKPEEIHPVTKGEDYLADCYTTGWIVFQSTSGDEKRRLCPWPKNWTKAPVQELRKLLRMAQVVPPHRVKAQREGGAESARVRSKKGRLVDTADEPDITDLQVVRTFRYPGGRLWTVGVVMFPEQGGPPVLRFTAGNRFIDLKTWTKDWTDQPDEILVSMLRRASPRRSESLSPETPRRRWDDQPQATT
jgi:hypothetical protein